VNVLMLALGDAGQVVEAIRREGIPGRLESFQGIVKWGELKSGGGDRVALVT
jgi:hypothetical protein